MRWQRGLGERNLSERQTTNTLEAWIHADTDTHNDFQPNQLD